MQVCHVRCNDLLSIIKFLIPDDLEVFDAEIIPGSCLSPGRAVEGILKTAFRNRNWIVSMSHSVDHLS